MNATNIVGSHRARPNEMGVNGATLSTSLCNWAWATHDGLLSQVLALETDGPRKSTPRSLPHFLNSASQQHVALTLSIPQPRGAQRHTWFVAVT